MPAGQATVGFVTQFRHRHPLYRCKIHGGVIGNWGETDVTLVYQAEEGARWLHPSGRPDFLTHGDVPWARNGWYLGSGRGRLRRRTALVRHRLGRRPHAAPGRMRSNWAASGLRTGRKTGSSGSAAEPKGEMEIDSGYLREPSELVLNYETLLWLGPRSTPRSQAVVYAGGDRRPPRHGCRAAHGEQSRGGRALAERLGYPARAGRRYVAR